MRTVLKDPGGDLTQGFAPTAALDQRPFTIGVQRLMASARGGEQPLRGQQLDPYRDYRGIPVIGAWHWSSGLNFGLLTEVDASEALATARSIDLLYLTLAGILTATIVIALSLSLSALCRGPAARLGDRFGRYKLLRKIGEGGIGEVYLAKHELLDGQRSLVTTDQWTTAASL